MIINNERSESLAAHNPKEGDLILIAGWEYSEETPTFMTFAEYSKPGYTDCSFLSRWARCIHHLWQGRRPPLITARADGDEYVFRGDMWDHPPVNGYNVSLNLRRAFLGENQIREALRSLPDYAAYEAFVDSLSPNRVS